MGTTKKPDIWLAHRRPNPQAGLRLFCFPYAGGGASIFRSWHEYLPTQIEVCPIQLPGRENRLRERPYKRLTEVIDALADSLPPILDKPFAFFGHSLGALIGFELARQLRQRAMPQPVHLFVSGARAPQIPDPKAPIHNLPDKEFVEAVRDFGGTPEEVLQHEELMEILLPCLRADFEVCETHIYQPGDPLSIPITAFGGWQDKKIAPDEIEAWRNQTLSSFVVRMFPGNHFFLHNVREELLLHISGALNLTSH